MKDTITILPIGLQTLVERLNFKYQGPIIIGSFSTYFVDMSDWNLSLTDKNPCIWVKSDDLKKLSMTQVADSLLDVVRERRWQNETVIVFADGPVRTLKKYLPAALPSFIVLNADHQKNIQNAASPTVTILEILLNQMSRSQLSPYEIHKPVTGNRFFGRQSEINKILQHPNTNYMFIGIRQIGKTSLLKEIQRRMDMIDPPSNGQIRRLYIDCTVIASELDFLRTLAVELAPSELKLLMGRAEQSTRYKKIMFDRFGSLHGEPVTFLVDEIDRLLMHVQPNSPLFDALRAASTARKARFIMAGYRQAMDAAVNLQSPFFDLVTQMRLGRLKRSDVFEMIIGPMERLRIKIQNRDGIVNRIYRETAGLPNYVQFYCKTLLDRIDEGDLDNITENDLRAVYENHAFRGYVLDTFKTNTNHLERALVYAIVSEDGSSTDRRNYSLRAIDGFLKKRNLNYSLDQLDTTCRNLEVAGVFNQIGKNFEFAIPLFKRMLRKNHDVDFLFDKTREEMMAEKIF